MPWDLRAALLTPPGPTTAAGRRECPGCHPGVLGCWSRLLSARDSTCGVSGLRPAVGQRRGVPQSLRLSYSIRSSCGYGSYRPCPTCRTTGCCTCLGAIDSRSAPRVRCFLAPFDMTSHCREVLILPFPKHRKVQISKFPNCIQISKFHQIFISRGSC